MSNNNIFLENLKKFNNKKALILESGQIITYNQLVKETCLLSRKLSGDKKKLVFLLGENNFETIVGYLAFIKKGFSIAILDSKINDFFLKNLIKLYKPSFIFCSKKKKFRKI